MTSDQPTISVVISDVDGTLVSEDKELTPATIEAAAALRKAGIALALTSSRPPRGIEAQARVLRIEQPLGGFNGGMIVDPQLEPLRIEHLADSLVGVVLDLLDEQGLEVWAYRDGDWFVLDPRTPHVRHNAESVGFEPEALASFDELKRAAAAGRARVTKLVGVSDDHRLVSSTTSLLVEQLGKGAAASRSAAYYVDVTSPLANKGAMVDFLADRLGISTEQICTIGDMDNDVRMFERSGTSIAMGNAEPNVKSQADHVSRANSEDGFAFAMEHFVLTRAPEH